MVSLADENLPMPDAPRPRRFGGAVAVGAGILLSRLAGLVRERTIAHYLGLSDAKGDYTAALRIPNLLQNLLGEGVMSASFIPVYARLMAEGKREEASLVARTVGTLLALVAALLSVIGVIAAGPLVELIAPGFKSRELTVAMVQILFPGTALLVMSAWCLGVLNSHRKFFLSYAAPVLWNTAIIAAAIVAGRHLAGHDDDIAIWLAWGTVIGSGAQFVVQLPTVLALLRSGRPALALRDPGTRQTLRAFVPVLLGRGSYQLSGYIDQVLSSFLGKSIVGAIFNAQTLYTLPVSLFGMAISASELPEMSSTTGDEAARAAHLQTRLAAGLRRVVFLVVPSAVAFVAIGGPIVALLYQGGRFTEADTNIVWIILSGTAIGLSAGTQSRLLGSAFYALGDTRTPLYAGLVRLVLTAGLGYALVLPMRAAFGYAPVWGAFGLTASAGFAAWIEFVLLQRWLDRRIGHVAIPVKLGFGALAAATVAGAAGFGAHRLVHAVVHRTLPGSVAAIAAFGAVYLGIMAIAKVPEADDLVGKVTRRFRRR